MTGNAFEGKLHSYRRTQEGAVVAFVIHPHDVTAELAMAPLGTRFMIGFSEIGDDETPMAPHAARVASEDSVSVTEPPRETAKLTIDNIPDRNRQAIMGTGPYAPVKPRTPFAELPPSQQAGICCKDEAFRAFLSHREGRVFCLAETADFIRGFCRITSRAQLDTQGDARTLWYLLYDEFAAWKLTRQYAESVRS